MLMFDVRCSVYSVGLAVAYLCLLRATQLMIVPLLSFIAVGIISYAGFLKLAARLLRYSVSWTSAFLFSSIMLVIVIFGHLLASSEPLARRIGCNVLLLVGQVVAGGWFFSGRGANRQSAVLGWSGGLRLVALMFAMMIVVALAIVMPVQVFLSNHLSPSP